MKDDIPSEIVFDLPLIKFSGRSAVKKLAVTAHITAVKDDRILEFLNKEIMKQTLEENKGKKIEK
ncbi:MAG: hypothetical protein GW754_03055 [Candidatus Pacebacteria bacterium]|nr:hypothetical protein [Candidatus Paceibacterota bacterium]